MHSVKAILIGDEPSPGAKSRTPFVHAKCAPRLQEWIDFLIGDEDYVIVNQCDVDKDYIWTMMVKYQCNRIVCLGTKAYNKFKDTEPFKLPHPSGLNRQINNRAKLTIALMHCKDYLDR